MTQFPTIFDEAIRRFEQLSLAFESFAESLMGNSHFTDWLKAFNLDDIYQGVRPDGSEIDKTPKPWQHSTKYERQTIDAKRAKGQVVDRVTLKDTGAFYNSVSVNITGSKQVRIQSNDSKSDQLIAVWGNVLGVSNDNLQQFIEIIRPEFFKFANEYFD